MPKKKKTGESADSEQIVIKRHGNRRLYNTETKTYVNYHDLAKLVRDGSDIKVIDSTTKEDVTKAVLIQVILEEGKTNPGRGSHARSFSRQEEGGRGIISIGSGSERDSYQTILS